jgi:hypothetical protein
MCYRIRRQEIHTAAAEDVAAAQKSLIYVMARPIPDKATVLAEAQNLHCDGWTLAQIAKQLGVRLAWLRVNMPVTDKREPLTAAELKAYRASLPPDERDPSARLLGDPLPSRSALAKRRG